MTLTPTEAETPATAHEQVQVQVLIREARQRGRRQRLRVGILLLLVVALGVAAVVLIGGPTEKQFARYSTGAKVTVLLPSGSPIHVLGELDGLSCPTSTSCWAVGSHYAPKDRASGIEPFDEPATLIEHWSGSHWHVVPSPTLGDFDPLTSVSCPTSMDCVAVGGYTETWSGHRWSLLKDGDGPLTVSCPRPNECVGAWADNGTNYHAELWNGVRWVNLIHPGNYEAASADVTCGSPRTCWFIGPNAFDSFIDPNAIDTGVRPAAVGWINHRWSVHPIGPEGAAELDLESISCVGSNFCAVVGIGRCDNAVSQRCSFASAIWNGHQWKVMKIPTANRIPNDNMSVACQSSADCLAVGGETLERFNGSTWLPLTLRVPRGLPRVTLLGVTAPNRSTYLVVGTTGDLYNVSGNAVIGVLDGRSLYLVQD
jgi:hypothetical protein